VRVGPTRRLGSASSVASRCRSPAGTCSGEGGAYSGLRYSAGSGTRIGTAPLSSTGPSPSSGSWRSGMVDADTRAPSHQTRTARHVIVSYHRISLQAAGYRHAAGRPCSGVGGPTTSRRSASGRPPALPYGVPGASSVAPGENRRVRGRTGGSGSRWGWPTPRRARARVSPRLQDGPQAAVLLALEHLVAARPILQRHRMLTVERQSQGRTGIPFRPSTSDGLAATSAGRQRPASAARPWLGSTA